MARTPVVSSSYLGIRSSQPSSTSSRSRRSSSIRPSDRRRRGVVTVDASE